MIKKDKIYELKIDEDDDVSGIDSISLVDEPAIEVNWVAFKKDKPHDFHIPDGEDDMYLQKLMSSAQSEQELLEEGWVIHKVIEEGKEEFAETNPNEPSYEDTSFYRIRYKYSLSPNIAENSVIPTTRQFCRELVQKDFVWRVEDIDAVTNDFGQSAKFWRGGYNCRHRWFKIIYTRDSRIVNKAGVSRGQAQLDELGIPTELTPDWTQSSTVTSKTAANPQPSTIRNLGLSKEDFDKISIDYDDTLSTDRGKKLAKQLIGMGHDLYIVTRRQSSDSAEVYRVADLLGIDKDKVKFTNGKLKWETIKRLGIQKHIDNNEDELKAIKTFAPGVRTEKFDYNVGTIGGYVDPGIKKKKKKGFLEDFEYLKPSQYESYSDYPESVKNNAKAVLRYVEENGWGSCGTEVGKIRANQLAKGEAISLDTVKRMYSYLSRHEVDLESSKGYGDGCGKLMYDSWGGKSALSWAESKINQAENMSKQHFQTDDEKRIVIGPAMIPDLKIFRKDKQGNPYYVYFTAETIKMIAEKYMKNKYIDNNDENHDGKAVKDVYVIESWIKEDEHDKSNKYGFESLPIGSWFVSMRVKNDEIWKRVKEGELNGFSVSGFFEEVADFCKEEIFLRQVANILKKIKE